MFEAFYWVQVQLIN